MTGLLLRILINMAALWAAVSLVPGIRFGGGFLGLAGVALVFGVLNTFLRPVLKLLTLPFYLLTLGLFTFILNALMLWLTAKMSRSLGLDFDVKGFGAAFLGALVVTVVSFALSLFTGKS